MLFNWWFYNSLFSRTQVFRIFAHNYFSWDLCFITEKCVSGKYLSFKNLCKCLVWRRPRLSESGQSSEKPTHILEMTHNCLRNPSQMGLFCAQRSEFRTPNCLMVWNFLPKLFSTGSLNFPKKPLEIGHYVRFNSKIRLISNFTLYSPIYSFHNVVGT